MSDSSVDTINCWETSFFTSTFCLSHVFLVKTPSCVSMLLHASKVTFLVVCCGGTMKSEEFLLSQTLPSCSNHPSSPDQPRAGNPGRSVVLSTNTQPPSFLCPLLSSHICLLSSHCAPQVSHGHYYLRLFISGAKCLLYHFIL